MTTERIIEDDGRVVDHAQERRRVPARQLKEAVEVRPARAGERALVHGQRGVAIVAEAAEEDAVEVRVDGVARLLQPRGVHHA